MKQKIKKRKKSNSLIELDKWCDTASNNKILTLRMNYNCNKALQQKKIPTNSLARRLIKYLHEMEKGKKYGKQYSYIKI